MKLSRQSTGLKYEPKRNAPTWNAFIPCRHHLATTAWLCGKACVDFMLRFFIILKSFIDFRSLSRQLF